MRLYGDVKCRACGVEIEDHPSMIDTCYELQQVRKFWHGCLDEIRDLRVRISDLERQLEEIEKE